MSRIKFVPLFLFLWLMAVLRTHAQLKTNTEVLLRASRDMAAKEKENYIKLLSLSQVKNWPLVMHTKNGGTAILSDVDPKGYPIYKITDDNIISAATIRTNQLWPGGSTGLNLNGSSSNMFGKIAIWDGGAVLKNHHELIGRVVQKDGYGVVDGHATHTSGTLIAAGVNPVAKGMANGAEQLLAYYFNNDVSEMLSESPNILVSNHSYGAIAGWYYNTTVTPNRWEFWGNAGDTVDYKFGYYDGTAQMWDSIAYNAPYYLIVKSAGNSHGDGDGIAVGQPYWRYNSQGVMASAGNRPAGISSDDNYNNLPTYSVAKNILTVGAVNPIPAGYLQASDVKIASFSSWGPSDDGRIKPDVVADGVNVLSSYSTNDSSYAVLSGTSMSSPAAAGSVFLLQEYYSRLHSGNFMRSATLKGLVIHTADEAGSAPGPDYIYGWGLMNLQKAASVITSDTMASNADQKIYENNLTTGNPYTINVVASGKEPLSATICWTDPKAGVDANNLLNDTTRKLVNDLDLRISNADTTYLPWTLNRKKPSNAATPGDDSLNNVEKVQVTGAVPGQTYTIKVSNKSVLQRGQQAYSLIISGIGGQAYCNSAPSSAAGARIDSVSFSNIHQANPAGCTTYTNFTSVTGNIHRDQTLPISVYLSSCDGSSASKLVKVFIDYNNNGVFDSSELVAQSGDIVGNGVFQGTITTPSTLTTNSTTRMRIVVVETTIPDSVQACGTYGKGETQDYSIRVTNPTNDLGVTQINGPIGTGCAADSQLVTVTITNFGSSPQINIPVSATVTNGASTVATLNFTYPDTIAAYSSITYTFQKTFKAIAGNSYTITGSTNLAGDQDSSNNQTSITYVAQSGGETPSGIAEVCANSEVFLKSTNKDTTNLAYWYTSDTATTPLVIGNNVSTNVLPSNNTYYLSMNDKQIHVGLPNKEVYANGGYNAFAGNFVAFTNTVPLTIESARLYIGSAGTITFTVADTSNYDISTGSYEYLPISSTTLNVYPTTPTTPALGTNINNPADTGAVFYLNLPVPEVGKHVIIIDCENGASIYRNNQISNSPYPFVSDGNVFSITGNSALSSTTDNLFQEYYYFFYNMGIQLSNCPGSQRVPVVAGTQTPPQISLTGGVLTSSNAINYQWYLNGSPIPGATSQTDTPIASGTYTVVESNSIGCTQTSNAIQYTSNGVGDISLKAFPNPSPGLFTLQFETSQTADLNIVITDMLGQIVYESGTYSGFTGIYNNQLNLHNLASGVYNLKVLLGNKTYVKKLVIVNSY